MGFRCLNLKRDGPVEYVELNRPDVRNALDDNVIRELTWWADSVTDDPGVRAVVLSGAGKVFCAGADVGWMARMIEYSQEQNLEDAADAARMFLALDRLPVPLIARVHGAALGGGAGLCAVCDIVVAADDTVFGFTEVKLGIVPAVIAPFVLAKIGRSAARELFLTGARFSAERARDIGLVHKVVPQAELTGTVEGYLHEILTSAPQAVATAKAMIPEIARRGPTDATSFTSETIARLRVSREGQEGLRAFLEKRKASWVP
ncbi:MAG TPA: enoyl-CoA hydratase-related protein [Vicinamibacterales bacterium]|nr:enoyl-CoA hydratase-related protein [Vicinamibacterales bacterium]